MILAAASLAASNVWAQDASRLRRIAYLNSSDLSATGQWIQAMREGLAALGWREGRNIAIDMRFAEGDASRHVPLIRELLAQKPDVLVLGTDFLAKAALSVTQSIPVLFVIGFDPVGLGVVKSLARPSGNATGISALVYELNIKRFSLLREMMPKLNRLGVIHNPNVAESAKVLAVLVKHLHSSGMTVTSAPISRAEEAPNAFAQLARARTEAVLMIPDAVYTRFRGVLAELALQNRMVTMFANQEYVDAGAVMSYAADFPAAYRRIANYVDKLFKGGKPGELPVEQANVYEFVVNLKTARALGVTVPTTVLLQATRVIE
jgi:putative ABC transport system substrate-binding protein